MDMDSALTIALRSATSLPVYALKSPSGAIAPFVIYQEISETQMDTNHNGVGTVYQTRVQITHVAKTYSSLKSVVELVRNGILASTSFLYVLPTSISYKRKEDNDIFTAIRDYMISWRNV